MDAQILKKRAAAIRMSKKEIARQSGLHEDAVGRILNGRVGGFASSLRKIEDAITAEEARLTALLTKGNAA